jgi:putative ABC transport system permease protein
MLQDLRFAWRRLRHTPGPALFAIVTLALGIGAATATFSVVQTALWRPMGLADQDRVVVVTRTNMSTPRPEQISPEDFRRLDSARDRIGISTIAGWAPFDVTIIGHRRGVLAHAEFVTGSYFAMLGVQPALGRLLRETDDVAHAPPVVVLSDAAWRTQFSSDPSVIGQVIRIGNEPFVVVGVARRGFRGVHEQSLTYPSAWVPMHVTATLLPRLGWRVGLPPLTAGMRMADGRTPTDVATALAAVGAEFDTTAPLPVIRFPDGTATPRLRRWTTAAVTDDAQYDQASEMGRLIVLLPSLVLLVACTNIANLVLSRNASRRQDFAVRRALGASRWQLVREQVIEQGAVALVGGLGAVGIALWMIRTASHAFQTTLAPFLSGAPIDWQMDYGVVPAVVTGVILSVLVAGVVPALHLTRDSLRAVLAQGDVVSTPRWRGRGNLIALQLGVSVGLFLIALVFVRILLGRSPVTPQQAAVRAAVPADAQRIAVASVPFASQGHDARFIADYAARALETIERSSGVESAGLTTNPALLPGLEHSPLPAVANNLTVATMAAGGAGFGAPSRDVDFAAVSAGYFAASGTVVVAGRAFEASDRSVLVINEGLALDLFGTTDAVGRVVSLSTASDRVSPVTQAELTIVGVVQGGDRLRPHSHAAQAFVPFAANATTEVGVIARAPAALAAPVGTVTSALAAADPEVAVAYVTTEDVIANGPLAFAGTIATGLVSLAALALVLATAGLYGVLSHVIARRTREFGIRVALGATPRAIMRLVLRDGFRPIAEGLFIGLGAATVIRFFMVRTMVQERVAPIDPVEAAICSALLLVAGAVACWRPARRATRVTPMTALRVL